MADDVVRADALLVEGWVRARSMARGLPQPVRDEGGWRVDTASAAETARYVFAAPADGIRRLGRTIDQPRLFLKLCGSAQEMQALLPDGWLIQTTGWMMVHPGEAALHAPLAAGFRMEMASAEATTSARIVTHEGHLVASGYAAEHAGVFVYDRILVEPPYRRQGFGRALMAALGAARRSPASQPVLVATEQGRALYATLGWQLHSPYTTAVRPDPS